MNSCVMDSLGLTHAPQTASPSISPTYFPSISPSPPPTPKVSVSPSLSPSRSPTKSKFVITFHFSADIIYYELTNNMLLST